MVAWELDSSLWHLAGACRKRRFGYNGSRLKGMRGRSWQMARQKKRQVKLELPRDPSAIYSNMVMITHNVNEVIFDFIQVLPNDDRARLQKRVIMTPTHSKLFLNALQENVAKYEKSHGVLSAPPRQTLADQLFGSVKPADDQDE